MKKYIISFTICILILVMCISIGSVSISPADALAISLNKLFGIDLSEDIQPMTVSIFWNIRIPRAIAAFMAGGALAVSGAVMQALLQNPLASSYTLGVSSGASVGAATVIISGITISFLRNIMLPVAGFGFALITVLFVIGFSSKIDRNVQNHTIILTGMVVSLFVSAILTLLSSLFPDHYQQIYFWMMGSFSGRNWMHVAIMTPVCILITVILTCFSKEMDILTFGDDQAMAIGVDVGHAKKLLIIISSLLTGVVVAFTGTIGFIDLVAPHVVRKIFGARHKVVLPMSFLYGGAFMSIADLLARTALAPREIPVGAITAIIGAPFFAYVYLSKNKR